jgi:hypothetical protein
MSLYSHVDGNRRFEKNTSGQMTAIGYSELLGPSNQILPCHNKNLHSNENLNGSIHSYFLKDCFSNVILSGGKVSLFT